jgi:hypothetical protein
MSVFWGAGGGRLVLANVYVDGFNLYYSALRWRFPDCKWLDVRKLAELLLPNDDIAEVKYFTAHVSSEPDNPNQHRRQQSYLRALARCEPRRAPADGRVS